MRVREGALVLGAGAVLVVAVSGCSSTPARTPAAAPNGPGAAATALLDAGAGSVVDFDVLDTPDEIATLSEIVVTGRVVDVQNGPVVGFENDELSDATTVMIAIGDATIVQGELAPESDGIVYVPLLAPGDPDAFGELIPIGSDVVFYGNLIDETPTAGSIPIASFAAGRPEGQPMYGLAHPQGLILDLSSDGSGDLVWPDAHFWADAPIEDALPGGDEAGEDLR